MSSIRLHRIIILLVIASVIGIGIIVFRQVFSYSCSQTDTKVCTILQNYQKLSNRPLYGSYIVTNQNDDSVHTVIWKKVKDVRAVSAALDEDPILDVILMPEYLYLKDFSDNSWWKQQVSDTPLSDSYLPFDPYLYFTELDRILFDEETEYVYISEIECGKKTCLRYQVKSAKQPKDLQRFIYVTSQGMQINTVIDATDDASSEIKFIQWDGAIREPENTKVPEKNQNIFLDYLRRQESLREKKFEYLQQFQLEREKAEEVSGNGPEYVEDLQTATPSGN